MFGLSDGVRRQLIGRTVVGAIDSGANGTLLVLDDGRGVHVGRGGVQPYERLLEAERTMRFILMAEKAAFAKLTDISHEHASARNARRALENDDDPRR